MDKLEFLNTKDPKFFTQPTLIPVDDLSENGETLYYRTFVGSKSSTANGIKQEKRITPYEDNENEMVSCTELDDNFNIKIADNGTYKLSLYVSPKTYGYIIGARGSRRREIESTTGTRLKIPEHGETGNIIISGHSERKVVSAAVRVMMIVSEVRNKHPPTHFVSVPLVSEMIVRNFGVFKEQILSQRHIRGIDESLFQTPEKLHLTIITLTLLDDRDIDEAVNVLHTCKSEFWEHLFQYAENLKIIMKGVEIMNDDPQNVDVLYAKVELNPHKYNTNFQKFANGIADFYAKKGLIQKQYENVKLHVTLMNSLFRKSDETNAKREGFNAEQILDKYKNYYFGVIDLKNMHLSIRFTTNENGYYDAATIVPLVCN